MTTESRAGMSVDRKEPPFAATERDMLGSWLEYHRATLARKCDGLTSEQLRVRAVPPSSLSLLGLVRHMAEVERGWFRQVLAGEDLPDLYVTDGDPEADFNETATAGGEETIAVWQAEIEAARRAADTYPSLDTFALRRTHRGEEVTLRWIMVHMIEEYARHNGHADLLRERIDGVVGDLARRAAAAACRLSQRPGADRLVSRLWPGLAPDQLDLVRLPGLPGERAQRVDQRPQVGRPAAAGQRDVRPVPAALIGRRRAGAAGARRHGCSERPKFSLVVCQHVRDEDIGPPRRGERPAAADVHGRRAVAPRCPAQPLAKVAEDRLGYLAKEGQGHVPAVFVCPSQCGPGGPQRRHGGLEFC